MNCLMELEHVVSSTPVLYSLRLPLILMVAFTINDADCQVRVYSGRGSGQVWTKMDEGREQRAGQEVSPAGVGDRLDSTTKDNER